MPTSFLGLTLFSTALALVCTFTTLGLLKLFRIAFARRRAALPPGSPRP